MNFGASCFYVLHVGMTGVQKHAWFLYGAEDGVQGLLGHCSFNSATSPAPGFMKQDVRYPRLTWKSLYRI